MVTENDLAAICQKAILNFNEAVLYSGYSSSSLRKLCANRVIPHSKPTGGRVLFSKVLLDEFLLSNPVISAAELKRSALDYVVANPPKEGGNM